jgi:hypothetical protein
MLGCGANAEQQQELTQRQQWVQAKMQKDPQFETTKLEWAKKLGDAELSVLDDPLKNYAQMGLGSLPDKWAPVSLEEFLQTVRKEMEKEPGVKKETVEAEMKRLGTVYAASKGVIVKVGDPEKSFNGTAYEWWPNREVPEAEVKDLARLKGHLQKGQWLTKFRKILRKDEMTDDLVLTPVPAGKEQEYVRIMPTSPP